MKRLAGIAFSFLISLGADATFSGSATKPIPITHGCDLMVPPVNGAVRPPNGGPIGITMLDLMNFKTCNEQAQMSCMGWTPSPESIVGLTGANSIGRAGAGAKGAHQAGQQLGGAKGSSAIGNSNSCFEKSTHCQQGAGAIHSWLAVASPTTSPTQAELTEAVEKTFAFCRKFNAAGGAYAADAAIAGQEVKITTDGAHAASGGGGIGDIVDHARNAIPPSPELANSGGIGGFIRDHTLELGIGAGLIGAGAIIENNTDGKRSADSKNTSLPEGCKPTDSGKADCASHFSNQCYGAAGSNSQCQTFNNSYCGGSGPGKSSMYCAMNGIIGKCRGNPSDNSMSCNWFRSLPANCTSSLLQVQSASCRPNLSTAQYNQQCASQQGDALCKSPFNLMIGGGEGSFPGSANSLRTVAATSGAPSAIGGAPSRRRDIMPMRTNLFQNVGSGLAGLPMAP